MTATDERIVKIIQVSLGSRRGHPYGCWRVVYCLPKQRGYKSEKNVRLLWESETFYGSRSKGPRSAFYRHRATANEIANIACKALSFGLEVDTPAGIVHDYELDMTPTI